MENNNIVVGPHSRQKRERAQQLRREMTLEENLLWQYLRDNRLGGLHFRRQQIIDGFIADFYCHAAGLIIEVDGSVHDNQADYDLLRDRVIAARGLHVLRIPNSRIQHELKAVLTEIQTIAQNVCLPSEWHKGL